jgi:hypothetical protein
MALTIKYGGPILVSVAPLIAALVAAQYLIRRGRLDARNSYAAEILKFRLRQVEDFYAPAVLSIEQSKIVYNKLLWTIRKSNRADILDDFRLLDHLFELKHDSQFQPLVEAVLTIGSQLTDLISKRASLIEGGITQTFIDYQAHYEILRAASEIKPTIARRLAGKSSDIIRDF